MAAVAIKLSAPYDANWWLGLVMQHLCYSRWTKSRVGSRLFLRAIEGVKLR